LHFLRKTETEREAGILATKALSKTPEKSGLFQKKGALRGICATFAA
jgi:hypothetical protein